MCDLDLKEVNKRAANSLATALPAALGQEGPLCCFGDAPALIQEAQLLTLFR